ncbi:M42 family peptidase [Flavonifractor sp. An10]|uniref:M42 family peptidase n=1 Tax=Flavonifractor sp. An10 TaxID=1965537 RepID=UPI000B39E489|nr:M42 family peptidase [Flavonifractor sp. An10]OUQ80997.1 peptidase M42 [Flavonifractor sp. An10]
MRQALERLCTCTAPSGFEGPAAAVAAELLRPLVDEVSIDRMGNVLGVRRSKTPGAPKLLLDAHLDEIGLIVTGVEDGFLRFRSIGGVDPRMLPGRELMVLTDPPLRGLVACPAGGDEDKSVPLNELYVDVGLSQEEAERAVPVGTPMVYRAGCFPLGEEQMCGKSMDDRACFVTLLRAAELLRDKELDVELHILGSTREEVSGAGAVVGTWAVAPDFCVAVDVTHGKTPDGPADKTFALGGGPAIGVGPNMTRWMTERMIAKAREHSIPYQLEIMSGHTGTNGWEMQISREGVATSVLSLPLKYMHTPVETLSLADMEGVAQLLAAFVEHLGKEAVR